jgi:F-type H+-transporting ATPase subunit delta
VRAGAIARRYARALFDLAREDGKIPEIGAALDALAEAFREVPDLAAALSNPAYTRPDRKALASRLVDEGLRLSPVLKNLLHLLIENGRVRELPSIADRYRDLADEAAGRAHVLLRSAAPLSDEDRGRVEQGLSRVTGKRVTLEVQVDASLIGGLTAQVGSLVFDGSVRAQLEALKQELGRSSS